MSRYNVEHNFNYHAPDEIKKAAHESARNLCKALAHQILIITPESREQSLALTKLEECMFWTNAAIARNE
jgi:hypothetical protein